MEEPRRRRPTPSRATVTAATITKTTRDTLREEAPASKTGFADDAPRGQMNSSQHLHKKNHPFPSLACSEIIK